MRNQWLAIVACAAVLSGFRDVPLKLSGCVVAGEKQGSFLLTNVVVDGAALVPARAFYRFNTTDALAPHVGSRVEVSGRADFGDVDRGRIRVRTEDGRTTTEITSERRTVQIDEALVGSGSMPIDADVPSYKFSVESVRRLQGNCESWQAAP